MRQRSDVRAWCTSVLAAMWFVAWLVNAATARACTAESAITPACHEPITFTALRAARLEVDTAPRIEPTADERALIGDLPFAVPDDAKELAAVTLVLGNRDNDFKGANATDATRLGSVHADPTTQAEHCLRSPSDDEPNGSESALAACRAYVRARALAAVDGIGSDGSVDASRRAELPIHLKFRGPARPALPIAWIELGRALHALQDGFTHTLRTPDGTRVRVVLNYADYTDPDDASERRDGPAHIGALDRCDDPDELRARNRRAALTASTELLVAVLAPAADTVSREARVDAVLARWLSLEPGCTHDNGWCGAPELALRDEGCQCNAAGAERSPAQSRTLAGAFAASAVLGLCVARRRLRRAALSLLVASCVGLYPAQATATETAAPSSSPCPEHCRPSFDSMPPGHALGVAVTAGGAIDNPAVAYALGARYRFHPKWVLGLDVEHNPWFSFQTRATAPGTLNVYATLIRRFRLRPYSLKLRTSAHVGTSTLLFELYGAPRYSTGPYLGLALLGLEFELTRDWSLVVDPADVALAVPQTAGTPLVYEQYRFSVGITWGG